MAAKLRMSENQIQIALVEYIRTKYKIQPVCNLNQLAGRFPKGVRIFLVKIGLAKGFVDLFIYKARKGYHGLAIELKSEAGTPTPEQLQWIATLAGDGYRAAIVYSLDDAIAVIDDYLGEEHGSA